MQNVANPDRWKVLAPLLLRIIALLATLIFISVATFIFIHKPAAQMCRERSADWLQSSLQFYFENTSNDDNKDFTILPGAIWNKIPQGWRITYTHNGKRFSAIVACSGDVRVIGKR